MKKYVERFLIFLLIGLILFGTYLRVSQVDYPAFPVDDAIFAVSALKIHHQSFDEGVSYVWNHPPLGKYIAGIFTLGMVDDSFKLLRYIPSQMFGFAHLAGEALSKTILQIRFSYLIFGILSILLVYLITSKLYSKKAGIWAAALFSLSLDFISLSINLYPENFMVFFMLLLTYFYLEYLYFSKKKILLLPFFISLLFLIGSRQFQPIIIAAILLSHYIFKNYFKSRDLLDTLIISWDILVVYLLAIIGFFITYSPLPPKEFTHSGLLQFGFQIINIFKVFIFRNSYLSLLGLFILSYATYSNRKLINKFFKDPSLIFSPKMLIPYLFLANLVSMTIFDFPHYAISRYLVHLTALLLILQGVSFDYVVNQKKKIVTILILIALVFTFHQLISASREHPPFALNSNFNVEEFALFPDYYGAGYNETIYTVLKELGNPSIMTNLPWLSTFYSGSVLPTPIEYLNLCTDEFFNQTKKAGVLTVVRFPEFFEDEPWASCQKFRDSEFEIIKELRIVSKKGEENKSKLLILRMK